MVTKPQADLNTISMARIDFKNDLTGEDSVLITRWLYQQKGVNHVLCNPRTKITVFTFYPVEVNATVMTAQMQDQLHYQVSRNIPSEKEMQNGCPVKKDSKVYTLISKIFNH